MSEKSWHLMRITPHMIRKNLTMEDHSSGHGFMIVTISRGPRESPRSQSKNLR